MKFEVWLVKDGRNHAWYGDFDVYEDALEYIRKLESKCDTTGYYFDIETIWE